MFGKKRTGEARKEETDNVDQYSSPFSFPIKKMEQGLWLIRHYGLFKKIILGCIIAFVCLIWVYVLFNWGEYLIFGIKNDNRMIFKGVTQETLIGHDYIREIAPKDIEIEEIRFFKNRNGYDIYALITNPGDRHEGRFDYCFTSGDTEVDCGEGFILPGGSKYLTSLKNDIGASVRSVKLEIKNLNWDKIDRHEINKWRDFKRERLNFDVRNTNFTSGADNEVSENLSFASLEFEIENKSPYNYYEVPLNIFLYRNSKIVAVNRYTVYSFMSRDIEEIEIFWPDISYDIDQVRIEPDVNILDKDSYINPGEGGY